MRTLIARIAALVALAALVVATLAVSGGIGMADGLPPPPPPWPFVP